MQEKLETVSNQASVVMETMKNQAPSMISKFMDKENGSAASTVFDTSSDHFDISSPFTDPTAADMFAFQNSKINETNTSVNNNRPIVNKTVENPSSMGNSKTKTDQVKKFHSAAAIEEIISPVEDAPVLERKTKPVIEQARASAKKKILEMNRQNQVSSYSLVL